MNYVVFDDYVDPYIIFFETYEEAKREYEKRKGNGLDTFMAKVENHNIK